MQIGTQAKYYEKERGIGVQSVPEAYNVTLPGKSIVIFVEFSSLKWRQLGSSRS